MNGRRVLLVLPLLASLAGVLPVHAQRPPETLPPRLTDQEFWSMVLDFSEPNGTFHSNNLVSNEAYFQTVIPELAQVAVPGRVYLGVGPEQNFSYIVAIKPKMAFIIDIRRGNRDLQLMYKALFELSADRAEFVSRLFARKRPEGLGGKSTPKEIFDAYRAVPASEAFFNESLAAIRNALVVTHGLPLSPEELAGVESVYREFFIYGPRLNYGSSVGGGPRSMPTYADLMVATDGDGGSRSYLATEDAFAWLKELESRNLVVPLVGDFAGPKAIRSVGRYLKGRGTVVSAFYLSNVEQFLYEDRTWVRFCGSVATLPVDDTSMFIRSVRGSSRLRLRSALGLMAAETKTCEQ